MDKQHATDRAIKAVLTRLGTTVGYEAEQMFKRYYLYYRSPNHALPTYRQDLAELKGVK